MRRSFRLIFSLSVLFFINQTGYSQIGIGNTNPDPSSILDITSDTQGVLTPRMTTIQRDAISSPAEGLLVFDTDENVFYFFDGGSWLPLEGAEKRDNYKLIKSAADLADELAVGLGARYTLDPDTLYEINGTITLAVPIDLNDAYLVGRDTNNDILTSSTGNIFSGTTGGSIKGLTLVSSVAPVFALLGTGNESLIFRDCVVANSTSVGTISNFNLVFLSIVQYINNANGIVYTGINELLLNSTGWDDSNGGVYETFVGDFDIITKQGGFSNVIGATAAVDVTGITSISGSAGMRNVSFFGSGNYINGSSPYTGYNFTNDWDVNCPGLKVETDGVATGDINLDYGVGSGATTSFIGTGTISRVKLAGNTTSNNLFRFTSATDNRITYDGKRTRYFSISASISFQGSSNNTIFIFYIRKNTTILEETKVYREVGENNDVGALAIVGTIELSPGDDIEVWAERYSGAGNLITVSMNLTAR